ncbi:hypothetical protein TeGR_g6790 [Tetraparma gracilis]|uniref:Uncharacterized protein n=1 Tax=Tetraparma gracilis TaxID=2962635 RepID=A0ABQ6N297_9STRA|nr:hypothetical protein TeGR_g6790 [Tetraparma gracilis]
MRTLEHFLTGTDPDGEPYLPQTQKGRRRCDLGELDADSTTMGNGVIQIYYDFKPDKADPILLDWQIKENRVQA